ncbi:hypothetical protein BgiMline_013399 [Biomphalaria glabrata]|nr:hypothetical protein BgiMline_017205 [Biomphalaria glabrata]
MDRVDVRHEFWNLSALLPHLEADVVLEWCARRRLVKNELRCENCNDHCSLVRYIQGADGYRWCCNKCGTRKSVRHGSFFTGSHLSIKQIIIIIYCWACDMPQLQMSREAGQIDKSIVTDWCNFLREECAQWNETHAMIIGGVDENFEPIVVEIDESKYFHRKYHRGQWREGHWVFGGVERESGRCFLVEVPDRRAATLEQCIVQHILPGSHIISDGWAAYANIPQIGQGIYSHSVIVHQQNFVDPLDPEIHTQNIENLWMRAKRKLKRQFGTSGALFQSYLDEFIYRNSMREEDMFSSMLIRSKLRCFMC